MAVLLCSSRIDSGLDIAVSNGDFTIGNDGRLRTARASCFVSQGYQSRWIVDETHTHLADCVCLIEFRILTSRKRLLGHQWAMYLDFVLSEGSGGNFNQIAVLHSSTRGMHVSSVLHPRGRMYLKLQHSWAGHEVWRP